MGESSSHEILEYLMEVQGIKQSDLVDIIGSTDVITEIIDGKRNISKNQNYLFYCKIMRCRDAINRVSTWDIIFTNHTTAIELL